MGFNCRHFHIFGFLLFSLCLNLDLLFSKMEFDSCIFARVHLQAEAKKCISFILCNYRLICFIVAHKYCLFGEQRKTKAGN